MGLRSSLTWSCLKSSSWRRRLLWTSIRWSCQGATVRVRVKRTSIQKLPESNDTTTQDRPTTKPNFICRQILTIIVEVERWLRGSNSWLTWGQGILCSQSLPVSPHTINTIHGPTRYFAGSGLISVSTGAGYVVLAYPILVYYRCHHHHHYIKCLPNFKNTQQGWWRFRFLIFFFFQTFWPSTPTQVIKA